MTAPNTNTHSSMDACPPLEDIAAFIDGMLPPEERERMTAHLARCESCYEIFAGAVEFQEKEFPVKDTDRRGVLRFPLSGSIPRKLLLAASIVLTAGVGFFAWQASRPPEITLDGVAGMLKDRSRVDQHLYEGNTLRGKPELGWLAEPFEFMAGVYLLELRLSGTSKATEDLLQKLGKALEGSSSTQDLAQSYLNEYVNFRGNEDKELETRLQTLEADVLDRLRETRSFSFGLWAEGGRLSAAMRSPEFFEDRNNRRFLSLLQKELSGEVDEAFQDIPDRLTEIERLWERESLGSEEYDQLAGHFRAIIETYDKLQEEELF